MSHALLDRCDILPHDLGMLKNRTYSLSNPKDEEQLLALLEQKEHIFYALLRQIADDISEIRKATTADRAPEQ